MNREKLDSIGRLKAIQRNRKLYSHDEEFDAILEAILDLDGRFRTHTHTKESP